MCMDITRHYKLISRIFARNVYIYIVLIKFLQISESSFIT